MAKGARDYYQQETCPCTNEWSAKQCQNHQKRR